MVAIRSLSSSRVEAPPPHFALPHLLVARPISLPLLASPALDLPSLSPHSSHIYNISVCSFFQKYQYVLVS
jgi:hypothetical protein